MNALLRALLGLLAAAILASCSGGGDDNSTASPQPASNPTPSQPGVTQVSSAGGDVELPGVAKATFPAQSLNGATVTITKSARAEDATLFTESAVAQFGAYGKNAYQVAIDVKGDQPAAPTTVSLTVPPDLQTAAQENGELRVFYVLYQVNEDESNVTLEAAPDRFAKDAGTVSITLPPEAFANDEDGSDIFRATLFLAFTPTGSPVDPAAKGPISNFQRSAKAAASTSAAKVCEGASLEWPVDPNTPVKSGFGMRTHPLTGKQTGHAGVDLGVRDGTVVHAAADGKVVVSTFQKKGKTGWGDYVVIQHSDGSTTLYAHLMSKTGIAVGSLVKAGDPIGLSDTTGGATGPHLHLEYVPNGKWYDKSSHVDPLPCLGNTTIGAMSIGDNGNIADDSFALYLEGNKICETSIGATNNCSLGRLRKGTYNFILQCLIAPDGVGTYGVSLALGLTFTNGSTATSGTCAPGASVPLPVVAPDPNAIPLVNP